MELYHHGVKGQKWGIRKYQYSDGTYTPEGRRHYGFGDGRSKLDISVSYALKSTATVVTGHQYVDGYLSSSTEFKRIQTSDVFEDNHAFFASYKKQDVDKYLGLFGSNLKSRAAREAKNAEKEAEKTGNEEDIAKAKELREKADSMKIYQLTINAQKKLKVPSDENAADITVGLLKDPEFKKNVELSIEDSKSKMIRPSQQILFNQAQSALSKEPDRLTTSEKVSLYKAFNLSLTNHNDAEIAAQNTFYGEMKKKGYDALLDYNDKQYSSYHAKKPMIVFNTDAVSLQAVSETDPKKVEQMYKVYNTERMAKETIAEAIGLVGQAAGTSVTSATAYVKRKTEDYLNS